MRSHGPVDPAIGRRMREIREAAGMTLLALAKRLNIGVSTLSEYETGKRMPSRASLKLIDTAVKADGELTEMLARSPRADNQRRDGADFGPLGAALSSTDTATAATELLRTYTSRLDDTSRGGYANPDTVAGFALIAAQYRRSYQAVPASQLLTAALAHLGLVVSLRPAGQTRTVRTSLVTTAGEMAALAGVLLGLDSTHTAPALGYLDLAWIAARAVEDVELQAVIMACRSFVVSRGREDHRAGLEYADLAREIASTGASAETRGWVAAVASERAASLGDLAGCLERLDESRQAPGEGDVEPVVWRGIGGFSADKLRAYEGGDMVRLQRFPQAIAILDEAVERFDEALHRHRSTALIDRAEAQCGAGGYDAACDDAKDALRLVAQVQHIGNLKRIQRIADRGKAAGANAARTLRHEIQLVRADSGLPINWSGK